MSEPRDVPDLLHAALGHHAHMRIAQAEGLYRDILQLDPDHPQALAMLGLILSDRPEHLAEAEAILRRCLDRTPRHGASLHALGRITARQGREEEALDLLRRTCEALPALAPAHNDLGACLHRLGRLAEALQALDQAVALDPAYSMAHANRGLALQESRRFEEAVQALRTALAHAPEDQVELRAAILVQLAQAARKAGQPEAAEAALRSECIRQPDHAELAAELALLLEQAGRTDEARAARNDLARRTGLRRGGELAAPAATVLLLGAVGGGHTPTRYLVDEGVFQTLSLTLLSPGQPDAPLGGVALEALAQADLVFNTLGDVDHDGGQFDAAADLIGRLGKPVLNPPSAIARTGRDQACALFAGIEGLIAPPVTRLTMQDLADLPMAGPVLVRPAGDHGGDNLVLLKDEAAKRAYAQAAPGGSLLLSPFFDFRSPDGYWRKYRLIFVDRQVFPYHLAIGDHWLSHYWRADMGASDWKRAEEEAFLGDWRGVFGEKAAAAAQAAAVRLDLDYGGMDCTLSPDGDLFLFEANACVLLHLDEPKARFAYKHRHVPPIREAFTRMALERAGKA
jgi:tetratricopeptide (TPR) repeat protein